MALFLATLDELAVEGQVRTAMVKATSDEKKMEIILQHQNLKYGRKGSVKEAKSPERLDSIAYSKSIEAPATFTYGLSF
jgi:hypothetical protein